MTNLFQQGPFLLHSGERSYFKIDCDALTPTDLGTLAQIIIIELLSELYYTVEGIPEGGLQLAQQLRNFMKEDYIIENPPLLIVDDVYTSGASMEEHRAGREATGIVIFARRPVTQPWIKALFTLGV